MAGHDSTQTSSAINAADLVTPDGMPLVWALRLLGHRKATRVYGPDLTLAVLQMAANNGIPVGLYGGSPAALERFIQAIRSRFPRLEIAYSCSPPFRLLTAEEDERVTAEINRSGARILFVGLGTPKQDRWMHQHKGRVQAVMLGVGAAFDFIGGTKPQAPRWMMPLGLEWLFRLATEPRRLAKRYLIQNPRFVLLFLLQFLKLRRFESA